MRQQTHKKICHMETQQMLRLMLFQLLLIMKNILKFFNTKKFALLVFL